MEFHHSTNIDTPEGLSLELTLAGLGSRAIAQLIDGLIRGGAIIALNLAVRNDLSFFTMSTIIAVLFLAYEIVFETVWSGQTPGKRASGLRVVMTDGSPVTFTPALVRNVFRLVDFLPAAYGVGGVMVFATKRHQRLGDLAAGTLVVRETTREDREPANLELDLVRVPDGFDATMVSHEQLALARAFLERRNSLALESRRQLADDIAAKLAPHVVDPAGLRSEKLIEVVVAVKTGASE